MLDIVRSGIGVYEPLANYIVPELHDGHKLSQPQLKAVEQILRSRDQVTMLFGAAGVGKTFVSGAYATGLKAAGRRIISLAPSAKAAQELQKEGFLSATTIARKLIDEDAKLKIQLGDIVLVDECGMVGSEDLLAVLNLAKSRGARVILQGDPTEQISSISRGDAMALIASETTTSRAQLLDKIRQRSNKRYREAMVALRKNSHSGIQKLVEMDAVREVSSQEEMSDQIAKEYFSESAKMKGNRKQSVLVVAATHSMIDRITDKIREEKMRRGEIDPENQVERTVSRSINFTEAQKRLSGGYNDTLVVSFHRKFSDSFPSGTNAQVLKVDEKNDAITIKNPKTGETVTVNPRDISKISDLQRVRKIQVAAGDKIMFSKNRKIDEKRKCTNSEVAYVQSVDKETGDVHLKDGRILKPGFTDFHSGFACSGHKSQGVTVDSVVVASTGMSRQLFYVAATRGRNAIKVFCPSLVELQSSVAKSGERKSATALARDYVADARRVAMEEKREAVFAKGASEKAAFRAAGNTPGPETMAGKNYANAERQKTGGRGI